MSKQPVSGRGSLADHPHVNSAAPSLASGRCGASRAGGGQEGAEHGVTGAPPSNTAPDNSNRGDISFTALRWGVDSLYLSYPGELFEDTEDRLKALKQLAQSHLPDDVAKAQFAIEGHVFEVKEKGASLFPYILEDGAFRIQLSRRGKKAPMAFVKVSAHFLAHVGPVEAEKCLYGLLSQLGEVKEAANVSRVDLFVDFQSNVDMEGWDRHAWVTRAAAINAYSVGDIFSGWSIGLGGIMSARLYNKSLEIITRDKGWVVPLWNAVDWDGQGVVWRLEFEIKREVLTEKGLGKLSDVLKHRNGLWSYATTEWLRLTLPNPDDQTRSRWSIHPLWACLASVDWEDAGGPLAKRFTASRSPEDDKLYQVLYSAVLSYMAKHGFGADELYEGTEDFLAYAYAFHDDKANRLGLSFDAFIAEKLALKRRQYNTLMNDPAWEARRQADLKALEVRRYRKAADGE